ncbi:Aste57867_8629 [Aphanomyces stellatus]|uniref:Aste57867_8629 protein n=1 Tax=Aphanomyces stellatus TaxID=120398 RepID=A0A485KKU5_9STRA|nr:hypothetical protein As57867_008595 [Aphanomyces stellatus]VFT85515.1 Aste57867_8629 [Aphanomyces stellatus]
MKAPAFVSQLLLLQLGSALAITPTFDFEGLSCNNVVGFNAMKRVVVNATWAQINSETRQVMVALVQDKVAKGIDVQCGCAAELHRVEICDSFFSLVSIYGSDDKPCRFQYMDERGASTRVYNDWIKKNKTTFFTGTNCDANPKFAFGLEKDDDVIWPKW